MTIKTYFKGTPFYNALERSRPAADASREGTGQWSLGAMIPASCIFAGGPTATANTRDPMAPGGR